MTLAIALLWLGILAGGWLGWQLLRQNGRLLLRLEELEKRLDTLEFGKDDQPTGLALGSEAPAFELPDLAGERKSLVQYRGQPLLLIFFNPACGFCRDMVPKLAALAPSPPLEERDGLPSEVLLAEEGERRPHILIVSTGGAEANRKLFHEHKLACPVLLQKETEVAATYEANGTPSGYLISPEGNIASELAIGADALLALATEPRSSRREEALNSPPQPLTRNSQPDDQSLLTSTATGNGQDQSLATSAATSRFSNRSLARSKIKRDGLKAGTPAPDFRLPRLDGRGELTLSELRGRRVLLVFSSPGCGPCNELAPELEKFHRANRRHEQAANSLSSALSAIGLATADGGEGQGEEAASIQVVMISKGEPKENRGKVKEHGLTFPVLLQQQWEISRKYAMFATPVAYLINESGVIAHDVAVGTDQILALLSERKNKATQPANNGA